MGADDHPTTDVGTEEREDIPEGLINVCQDWDEEDWEEWESYWEDGLTTESEMERHPLTNDLGFGLLLLIYLGVWSWLHYHGMEVFWIMDLAAATAFLTAVVWGYGSKAAEATKELLQD